MLQAVCTASAYLSRRPQVQEALMTARTRVAELEALLKIKQEEAARDQVCWRESWMLYFG
jgi:hypothetical protein